MCLSLPKDKVEHNDVLVTTADMLPGKQYRKTSNARALVTRRQRSVKIQAKTRLINSKTRSTERLSNKLPSSG
jgi:hypothetical protein